MTRTAIVLVALLALAGCHEERAQEPGVPCRAVRDLAARSIKTWTALGEAAPKPDAPLDEIARHTSELARAAKDTGAAFAKLAPRRQDLAETAEGAQMLGDLAGKNLEAYAQTMRDLDRLLPELGKIEGGANDAASAALADEAIAATGCGGKAPPKECGAVTERVAELERPPAPAGFVQAAQASRARADDLDALAKAVEALPPAPPKQKAREDEARRARGAADAFRALAKALEAGAPVEERLGRDREQAEQSAARFTAELIAASKLCPAADAGAPAASGSAGAPSPSAAPSGSSK